MKYSIVIPTYNEEKLLPQILRQLTDKRLRERFDFEIIVSDGKSTDNTVKVAEKYADKVIVHKGEKRQNIAEGRNCGAENSEGEVLIFLNGDILIENPLVFFERIENSFSKDKYLAMTCRIEVFPEERKTIDKIFHGFYNYYFYSLNLIGIGMGRGECHIIFRNVFFENKMYDRSLAAGEDFDLYKRIRKHGKILYDMKMKVFESPRRYRKYGHFNILFKWLFNSIYVMIFKKSLSKEWEPVR